MYPNCEADAECRWWLREEDIDDTRLSRGRSNINATVLRADKYLRLRLGVSTRYNVYMHTHRTCVTGLMGWDHMHIAEQIELIVSIHSQRMFAHIKFWMLNA
jgi:hypothetical protein